MDLSDILADPELSGASFTVIRETWRKSYGEAVLENSQTFKNLAGNIQPASSEDVLLFPQEERSKEIIQILSSFAFSSGTPDMGSGTFIPSDNVIYRGRKYKVIRVKDWELAGGFHKAWAVSQQDDSII